MSKALFAFSGDSPIDDFAQLTMAPLSGEWLTDLSTASTALAWLSANDIAYYAGEFKRTGFSGGLNWYRNSDRNWELSAPWTGAKIQIPALCMLGDRDIIFKAPGMDQVLANPSRFSPKLQDSIVLKGCGHWTQQERPKDVNDALLPFLRKL